MIAQLCLTGAKGGLELSGLRLALDFRDRTHFKSAMIVPQNSFLESASQAHHLDHLSLPTTSTYLHLRASLKLRKFVIENDINTIFVHSLKDLWLLYPSLISLPHVQVIGIAHMFLRNINKKDFLHRLIYSRLKHLVVLTEAQKKELLLCLPVPEDRYVLIPNGVDTDVFSPGKKSEKILKEWDLTKDDFIIGYVGRLDPQKGVFELLQAARKFKNQKNIKFVFLGDDTLPEGPTKAKLLQQTALEGLSETIRFIPFRSDIETCMKSFDLFVMPSYQETFGLVLIEAMASGLPSIATNAGGPPEILNFGEAGLLVAPRSSDAIYKALANLIENERLRHDLAVRARQRAVENFDKNLIFKKIQSLVSI